MLESRLPLSVYSPMTCYILSHPTSFGSPLQRTWRKRLQRPVHTSLPTLGPDRHMHVGAFIFICCAVAGCSAEWLLQVHCAVFSRSRAVTITRDTSNSHLWESDPGMKVGGGGRSRRKEKKQGAGGTGSHSLSTKPSLEEDATASYSD